MVPLDPFSDSVRWDQVLTGVAFGAGVAGVGLLLFLCSARIDRYSRSLLTDLEARPTSKWFRWYVAYSRSSIGGSKPWHWKLFALIIIILGTAVVLLSVLSAIVPS